MSAFEMKISLASYKWPNSKPVGSEILSDGRTRFVLEDGRAITVHEPNYRLEYLSSWLGAMPGETYEVNIAILGLSAVNGFYEVWNFDLNEARNYSFAKTKKIVHLGTSEEFTGLEIHEFLTKC